MRVLRALSRESEPVSIYEAVLTRHRTIGLVRPYTAGSRAYVRGDQRSEEASARIARSGDLRR